MLLVDEIDVLSCLPSTGSLTPAEGDKLLVIFRSRTLDQADVDRLQLDTTEVAEARVFPVEQLAHVMPARLARRVAEAATQDSGTSLEHGRSLTAPVQS